MFWYDVHNALGVYFLATNWLLQHLVTISETELTDSTQNQFIVVSIPRRGRGSTRRVRHLAACLMSLGTATSTETDIRRIPHVCRSDLGEHVKTEWQATRNGTGLYFCEATRLSYSRQQTEFHPEKALVLEHSAKESFMVSTECLGAEERLSSRR